MSKKTKEQRDAETRERLRRNAERLRSAAAASGSDDVNAYINARLAEARAAALEKSRTRTMPAVPVGGADDNKKKAEALRNDASLVRSRLSWPAYEQGVYHPLDFNYSVNGAIELRHVDPERLRIAALRRASELEKEAELYETGKKLANGASCIYTATDNYGKQYRVASNRAFEANDVSNGFLRIPMSDVEPGDIVQSKVYGLNGVPGHGMILDSTDGYFDPFGFGRGDPAFNYSNGGEDENAIVRGGHFTDKDTFRDDNQFNAFRFVGTPADSLRWKSEYEQMNQRGSGGFLRRFDAGRDKENDALAQAIMDELAKKDITRNELGLPAEKPLELEHPDLDLALMFTGMKAPETLLRQPLAKNAVQNIDPGPLTEMIPEIVKKANRRAKLKDIYTNVSRAVVSSGIPSMNTVLHADELTNKFDEGGDKDNDALAKAIIARVNQEEAAKARAEGAPMMGEKPLESEDYLFGLAAFGAKAPVIESMAAAKSFASAHPWLMRAIDVAGTADSVRNLVSNNGISKTVRLAKEGDVNGAILSGLGDLFDMIGGADAARMISKLGDKSYRAYHAFNSFAPYSYDDVSKKGGAWLKSMLSEKKYSDVPPWRGGDSEAEFYNEVKDAFGEKTANFMKNAREDAWAIYLGREPRNGMYVKNADGTFSYNIDKLSDAYKDNPNFSEILKYAKEKKFDSIGVTHGGLWDASSANTGHVGEGLDRVTFGNFHMEDMWDLQPFQRHGDAIISARLNNKLTDKFGSQAIRDRAQAFREWMYDNGHWGDYGKKNSVFGALLKPFDRPLNVYRSGWTRRLFKDTPDYVPEMFTIGDEFAPAGYHYEDVQIPRIADNIIDAITDNNITRFFDSRVKDFEAGRILGGTPFYMKTDIPYTSRVQINPDKVEAFNPENFQVITEFGRNVPNGYIDPGKLINFRFTDFHGGNIINSIDLSNITNGINRDGGLIERYGKDKILSAIAKMRQSK